MKGSLKIVRLFGIPVRLHWSFMAVPALVAYLWVTDYSSVNELLWLSLFAFSLFTCILLHEFGHALTARRYGVETKDIILLPIGGLARLNRLPERPVQELAVALAGPLVNLVISLLLLPYLFLITMPQLQAHAMPNPESVVGDFFLFPPMLFALNVGLAVFNLIPAFPMDGGRVFRALLSMKFGRLKATRIAVYLGYLIAIGMVVTGLWSGRPSYTLIGIFIYFTASREFRWVKTESQLSSHLVQEVFQRNPPQMLPVKLLTAVPNPELADYDNQSLADDVSGSFRGLPKGPTSSSPEALSNVGAADSPIGAGIEARETLKTANEIFQSGNLDTLPVLDNGIVVGTLEPWMIWDYLSNLASQKKAA